MLNFCVWKQAHHTWLCCLHTVYLHTVKRKSKGLWFPFSSSFCTTKNSSEHLWPDFLYEGIITYIQCCISFRCTTWFSICVYCKNQPNKSCWHCHHTWLVTKFSFSYDENFYSLSNFQVYNIVVLSIVTMQFITSPLLIYFIVGILYLLTPFNHFAHPLPPTSGKHKSVPCIYELVLFVFENYTVFVLFCLTHFTWHNALKVNPYHCEWQYFIFHGWIIFHCWCACDIYAMSLSVHPLRDLGYFCILAIVK